MKSHVSAAVAFAIFAACTASAGAQGLADLAKKSEDAKKAAEKKKATGKKYTNADAGNVQAATALSQPGSGGSAAKPAAGGANGAAETPVAPAGDAKDQAYYAGKAKELRSALDRDTVMLSAMQTQINSLTTDFVNRDDPAQRGMIQADRNRALEELARLQKQVDADKKAISDFEDEARRANVPPGWLR